MLEMLKARGALNEADSGGPSRESSGLAGRQRPASGRLDLRG
jgi:hypothetical protein